MSATPLRDGFVTSLNLLLASGYTGQTTEVLAPPNEAEAVVGVGLPSYVTASVMYRFRD